MNKNSYLCWIPSSRQKAEFYVSDKNNPEIDFPEQEKVPTIDISYFQKEVWANCLPAMKKKQIACLVFAELLKYDIHEIIIRFPANSELMPNSPKYENKFDIIFKILPKLAIGLSTKQINAAQEFFKSSNSTLIPTDCEQQANIVPPTSIKFETVTSFSPKLLTQSRDQTNLSPTSPNDTSPKQLKTLKVKTIINIEKEKKQNSEILTTKKIDCDDDVITKSKQELIGTPMTPDSGVFNDFSPREVEINLESPLENTLYFSGEEKQPIKNTPNSVIIENWSYKPPKTEKSTLSLSKVDRNYEANDNFKDNQNIGNYFKEKEEIIDCSDQRNSNRSPVAQSSEDFELNFEYSYDFTAENKSLSSQEQVFINEEIFQSPNTKINQKKIDEIPTWRNWAKEIEELENDGENSCKTNQTEINISTARTVKNEDQIFYSPQENVSTSNEILQSPNAKINQKEIDGIPTWRNWAKEIEELENDGENSCKTHQTEIDISTARTVKNEDQIFYSPQKNVSTSNEILQIPNAKINQKKIDEIPTWKNWTKQIEELENDNQTYSRTNKTRELEDPSKNMNLPKSLDKKVKFSSSNNQIFYERQYDDSMGENFEDYIVDPIIKNENIQQTASNTPNYSSFDKNLDQIKYPGIYRGDSTTTYADNYFSKPHDFRNSNYSPNSYTSSYTSSNKYFRNPSPYLKNSSKSEFDLFDSPDLQDECNYSLSCYSSNNYLSERPNYSQNLSKNEIIKPSNHTKIISRPTNYQNDIFFNRDTNYFSRLSLAESKIRRLESSIDFLEYKINNVQQNLYNRAISDDCQHIYGRNCGCPHKVYVEYINYRNGKMLRCVASTSILKSLIRSEATNQNAINTLRRTNIFQYSDIH